MTRILLATVAAATLGTAAASAQEPVNVGILLGFTGPLETIMPNMATSAELAFKEASESGLLPAAISPVRADSTCVDAAAATAAAERLVTADKVAAIMGADCSGVTMAVLQNVAIPNGVPMISPSATSPALTTVDDKGLFFRTAPSDARQGEVLAEIMKARGVTDIAVTYTNNDYGKGLADSFAAAFTAGGGTVSISAPHDDGKADYAAEVAALQASGAKTLAVFGYIDQGGRGIVQGPSTPVPSTASSSATGCTAPRSSTPSAPTSTARSSACCRAPTARAGRNSRNSRRPPASTRPRPTLARAMTLAR